MGYLMDDIERRKKQQERYRKALERRLSKPQVKAEPKETDEEDDLTDLTQKRKAGYYGGLR